MAYLVSGSSSLTIGAHCLPQLFKQIFFFFFESHDFLPQRIKLLNSFNNFLIPLDFTDLFLVCDLFLLFLNLLLLFFQFMQSLDDRVLGLNNWRRWGCWIVHHFFTLFDGSFRVLLFIVIRFFRYVCILYCQWVWQMINFTTYLMLYTRYLPIYFLVNFLNAKILANHSFLFLITYY